MRPSTSRTFWPHNPGERILDACAAPGGKACHLLELQPALEALVAADVSAPRLQRVLENSARLGITLSTAVADASALPDALLARPFDAILADVPCSATGVLRRNPDIKILRQPDDVDGFARQQLAILQGLWPALAVDGRLLYVTCSLLQAENDDVIARFAASNGSGAVVEPLQLPDGSGAAVWLANACPTRKEATVSTFRCCAEPPE